MPASIPSNLLWVRHFGNVILGAGLLAKIPYLVSTAFFWLIWGNSMWLFYLAGGGEVYPTSLFTHVGGLIIAIVSSREMGIPKMTWLSSVISLFLFQRISYYASQESENINMSHAVPAGWENVFIGY